MNKRTRYLAVFFGAVIVYMAGAKLVYPDYIAPQLNLTEQIAERQEELDKLRDLEQRFFAARERYRNHVARVGRFDADLVRNEVLERINDLIKQTGLQDCKRTPGRPRQDRKAGWTKTTFSLSGEGTLESVISFLKQSAELPHLVQFRSTSISPASTNRRNRGQDRMDLRTTFDVLVPPRHKLVRLKPQHIPAQPAAHVRHVEGRSYAPIWEARPFSDYVAPPPPRPKVTPRPPPAVVETPRPTPKPVEPVRPAPPPPPSRWRDRAKMRLTMALITDDGTSPRDEVIIHNSKNKNDEFVAAGAEFDGGTLLLVHQYGAVVERGDDVYFYPIGGSLDGDVRLAEADGYPDLQAAALRLRTRRGHDPALREQSEGTAIGGTNGPGGRVGAPRGRPRENAGDTTRGEETADPVSPGSKPGAAAGDRKATPRRTRSAGRTTPAKATRGAARRTDGGTRKVPNRPRKKSNSAKED